ncbi:MAG: hypothetical protein K2X11_15815, partial [Acetobacteraceae bacterium]|nr:hypothetical protein [Acetobacteraceae bacterium]
MRQIASLGFLLLAALPGCKDPTPPAQAASAAPRVQAAVEAATDPLRQRLRAAGDLRQRGVQVFAQALPGTYAVCGRVNPTGLVGDAFVPYVALIVFEREAPQVTSLVIGMNGNEASRTYVEMAERCFDGGGPPSQRVAARSLPPLPEPPAAQPALQL